MIYLNEINTQTLMNFYKKSCAELREFLYIFEDQYLRNDIQFNKENPKAPVVKKKEEKKDEDKQPERDDDKRSQEQHTEEAKEAFDKDIDFRKEICEINHVSYDDSVRYEKFLVQRIQDVEKVIDEHLNVIKSKLIDMQAQLIIEDQAVQDQDELKKTLKEELEAVSYEEKLDLLITYQDLLIESDKNDW